MRFGGTSQITDTRAIMVSAAAGDLNATNTDEKVTTAEKACFAAPAAGGTFVLRRMMDASTAQAIAGKQKQAQ